MLKLRWLFPCVILCLVPSSLFAQQESNARITPSGDPALFGESARPSTPPPLSSSNTHPTAAPDSHDAGSHDGSEWDRQTDASGLERFMSDIVSTDAQPVRLKQFGYDLFATPPPTFAPTRNVPVGPQYVLGPGDEIRLTLWGTIELEWAGVVDRDGNISLPKIGVLGVTGLTYQELKEVLHQELSRYFTDFQMNVSMGALRVITVYVVGNVQRPAAYTVHSLSTLVNALMEAGGPSKVGTMRDIQLRRSGNTIAHFDMYALLLQGDKTGDVRLMPEDVLYVPPIGPVAGIVGSVNTPAIYELKGETHISELIEMAGGLNALAYAGRLQIRRIIDGRRQIVFESDWDATKEMAIPRLQSGDVVRIFPVVRDERVVRLAGAVLRPGDYGYTPGTTLKDLIEMAGGLQYYANRRQTEITRIHITQDGPQSERLLVDLTGALRGDEAANLVLQADDYVFIRAVPEWQLYRTVTISGEVKFPGTYTVQKNEPLSSVIERAGGFNERAYLRGAVFTRKRVARTQQRQLEQMADRLERELLSAGAAEASAVLTADEADIVVTAARQQKAFIAALRGAKATGRMVIALTEPEVLKATKYDIELEEGDTLSVPTNPSSVQVLGAVFNPSAFVYDPGTTFGEYIKLAGGYTKSADAKSAYILKVDGSAVRPGGGRFHVAWRQRHNRWEMVTQHDIEPGDTVIVPQRLERVAWLRNIKDISQILFQAALATAVVLQL